MTDHLDPRTPLHTRKADTSYLPWILGALMVGGGLIAFAISEGERVRPGSEPN